MCSSLRDPFQRPTVPARESRYGLVGALEEVQDHLRQSRRTAGGLIARNHDNVHRKFTSTSGTKSAAQRSSARQSAGSPARRDAVSATVWRDQSSWSPLRQGLSHPSRRATNGRGFVARCPGASSPTGTAMCAAGDRTIRWKNRDYSLLEPEVIGDAAVAAPGFSALERAMMTRLGIKQALRLRLHS